MSKQSYKDIQSDAPARHEFQHLPVENIGNAGYNENAGIMGGQRPVEGGATCTDAEHKIINAIRKSSDKDAAIKEAISVILYALEFPQLLRQQYHDLLLEEDGKDQ
ncbi:hypothetical protein [Anaerotruncus rubiinfantis]|uniref:hypothetical protein n=1 Tax=Anaerotruncus rubiinfantis TaxID=1720200 RepID=UPI001899B799|nr:hypothetical protein [Anaerotruncus rubiinfantis]